MYLVALLSSSSELAKIAKSSAYNNELMLAVVQLLLPELIPDQVGGNKSSPPGISFIYRLNNVGDKTQPCLTPKETKILLDKPSLDRMRVVCWL